MPVRGPDVLQIAAPAGSRAVAAALSQPAAGLPFGQSNRTPTYRLCVGIALSIAFVWSFSGLIFRHIEAAEPWAIIFYRSLGVALGVTLVIVIRYRRAAGQAFLSIGKPGLAAAVCLGTASVFFLQALHFTTIANISFLVAAHPFFAAALAWLLLKEKVTQRTWIAAALALIGVLLMVLEGIAFEGGLGNILGLGAAILSAGYAVALRFGRRIDMTPAVALSGILALIFSAPLVVDFRISWHDFGLCLLQGMVISAICNSLFAYAARSVPAAELTLFTLLETVLAPLWVWLAISETPSVLTLIGGAIILIAILGHAYSATRRPSKTVRSGPFPV
jgi:drug/metabolite transporter (DMT)-like permease